MANIRKSFNFRNGVQVDNDKFIVNANGLVGIGTSIPTEALDLIGNAKISGLTTIAQLGVAETANFYDDLNVGDINLDPATGDISATRFVGDASGLTNIFAISTTGWVAEGVGLHTFRSVGIGTTNPLYNLQIGSNPADEGNSGTGINGGNILASGVITATTFSGALSGDVTGNVQGNVTGSVTGNADTATQLQTARSFLIGGDVQTSTSISFNGTGDVSFVTTLAPDFDADTTGIITASKFDGELTSSSANITNADVGIGTFDNLRIDNDAGASLVVTSTTNSSVSIGESVGAGNSSAQLLYTPGTGRLDIDNYDVGGISFNLHKGTGVGNTESFNVKYNNVKQFEVTYDGKVAVNRGGTVPTRALEVGGDLFVDGGNTSITGVLTVNQGGPNEVTFGDGSSLPSSFFAEDQNFNTTVGISTFNDFDVQGNLEVVNELRVSTATTAFFAGDVGIGTTGTDVFLDGPENLRLHVEGSTWSKQGFYTPTRIILTDEVDGNYYVDNNRSIPDGTGPIQYGEFQIKTPAASFFSSQLLIVPDVGVATDAYGLTDRGLIAPSLLPDGNGYLTYVGINTYYVRSILDVGTGSTSMNSYFIPPSLSQDQIDVVANLWQNPTGFGTAQAKKVTPNGLVPGAIIHNATRDKIQVRESASSFRNLSPVVAFGTVVSGSLVSTDGYNFNTLNTPTNSSNDATFNFSTALQSANYTVIVSNQGTETFTVPEADKSTTGFKITFTNTAAARSYSVMVLQV